MVVLHLMAPNAGSQETSEPTLPAARLIGHPYFEPSLSKLQRDTIMAILPRICLVKWKTFSVTEDGTVEWNPGEGPRSGAPEWRQDRRSDPPASSRQYERTDRREETSSIRVRHVRRASF